MARQHCMDHHELLHNRKAYCGIITILWLLLSPDTSTGALTYTIKQTTNTEAYNRIKIAMDSALYYYNTYTTIAKKVTVEYASSVPTAQANSDGLISFGSNPSYQVVCTAMHEIAHAVGIGTTSEWNSLMNNGIVNSERATQKLREITGNQNDVLKGDKPPNLWHFWPYGLNYVSEVKSEEDLINHCLIVNELYYEMYPDKEPPKTPLAYSLLSGEKYRPVFFSDINLTIELPANSSVTATILTLDGKIADQFSFSNTAGIKKRLLINPSRFRDGMYLYRISSGTFKTQGSLILTR